MLYEKVKLKLQKSELANYNPANVEFQIAMC